MFVVYPAIFYKFKNNDGYMVYFKDLQEGATEGKNLEDSYFMAGDYIASWVYDDYVNNKKMPKASNLSDLNINDCEYIFEDEIDLSKSFKTLVGIDMDEYIKKNSKKPVKKTVTIPSYLNELGISKGINFSKVLTAALEKELELG
ncbi:MAG: type II toxin-antitoxin system HicB family antitoxin [Peptoniphilaceae bacterium]|nr:type II toxin-antitoxin system HicB family antitoxin [Peptoniphilaceae bacterium]MDD7383802.1 type II toxin-antitoxin system HicB family antitoxin [Peptoniphilaceae bacterium]MDY3737800.1 type II toxin-antitoxin system HicB family antitoxin [Peptoniphilaceae bacterium]